MRIKFARVAVIPLVAMIWSTTSPAASWTRLKNLAPSKVWDLTLLTDGTVMVQEGSPGYQRWWRLTPDVHGSYITGDYTSTPPSVMITPRREYASKVLPSGKYWITGGAYSGYGIPSNFGSHGEIFDPVNNIWSPSATAPDNPVCPCSKDQFGGTITAGSSVIQNIISTVGWQPGWALTPNTPVSTGLPVGTKIVSVDSPTQITVSSTATRSGGYGFGFLLAATGATRAGTNIITDLASTVGSSGWGLSGPGIPSGTVVTSILSPTSVRISQNATATATGAAITFNVTVMASYLFGDLPSMLMPGGKIMTGANSFPGSYLYDIASDSWSAGPDRFYKDHSGEEGWVMLADGSVVAYDIWQSVSTGGGYAERYDPVTKKWTGISPADGTAKGTMPQLSSHANDTEVGPLLRLYDDRVFAIGATGHTALYTPSTNTWAAGPDIIGNIGGNPVLFAADDSPAAILPNGHVIFAADAGNGVAVKGNITAGSAVVTGIEPGTAGLPTDWAATGTGIPSGTTVKSIDSPSQLTLSGSATLTKTGASITLGGIHNGPTQLFEFDPSANVIAPVSPAIQDPLLNNLVGFAARMIMLPTGQLLFADNSFQLWVYTPDGAADPTLTPTIQGITSNGGGSLTLSGTRLTGQSAGSHYGDEVQSESNFPIVGLTSLSGDVYYARTSNWSYIGVGGGSLPQTVDFTLNPRMSAGIYALRVSGAGIASQPVMVTVSSDLSTVSLIPATTPTISSVQDAESARASIVSGQWVAIYGSGLGFTTRTWKESDFTGGTGLGAPLPVSLDGNSVTIGGKAAAVYFVSPGQFDVLSPSNLPDGPANVVVTTNGIASAGFTVIVEQASPSFFSYAAGSNLYPAAVHLSGMLVGDPAVMGASAELAHPGETLLFYASGLGPSPGGVIVAPALFSANVTVTAGSYPLNVLGAALVSAGQFQVNVQLPKDIPAGNYPLTMTVPSGTTQTSGVTVTLPVGP